MSSKYLISLINMAHVNHVSDIRCYLLGLNANKDKADTVCPDIECNNCIFSYEDTDQNQIIKILENST